MTHGEEAIFVGEKRWTGHFNLLKKIEWSGIQGVVIGN